MKGFKNKYKKFLLGAAESYHSQSQIDLVGAISHPIASSKGKPVVSTLTLKAKVDATRPMAPVQRPRSRSTSDLHNMQPAPAGNKSQRSVAFTLTIPKL